MQELTHQIKTSQEESSSSMQELGDRIQTFRDLYLDDKEKSVPRFPYLKKEIGKGECGWITDFKDILSKPFLKISRLHFLCEDPHFEKGVPHEVEDQEGLKLKDMKVRVKKLLPVLEFVLPIIVVAGNIAARAVLPGVQLAVPADILTPVIAETQTIADVSESIAG